MRIVPLITFSVLLMIVLVACGGKEITGSDANKYVAQAEGVIGQLNDSKYEEVRAMFDEEMKKALSLEAMDDLTPIINDAGNFEKIKKGTVKEKDGYYTEVLTAKYSEGELVYTISFNGNDEVAGLFIK